MGFYVLDNQGYGGVYSFLGDHFQIYYADALGDLQLIDVFYPALNKTQFFTVEAYVRDGLVQYMMNGNNLTTAVAYQYPTTN